MDPPKANWADKVKITDSSSRCKLLGIAPKKPGTVLEIPDEIVDENVAEWRRCLVGFFPGYVMPFHAVRSLAMRAWKSSGLEDVRSTNNGFLIFRFQTEEEVHNIIARGPWMFGGKTIILQPWNPHFNFNANQLRYFPVWIRLYGLPFPLWTTKGLSIVSSMVGQPVSCDKMTSDLSRLEYARVCVLLDAKRPPIQNFEFKCKLSPEPIEIKVEYEWIPKCCYKCRRFGHRCPESAKTSVQDKIEASTSDSTPSDGAPLNLGKVTTDVAESSKAVAIPADSLVQVVPPKAATVLSAESVSDSDSLSSFATDQGKLLGTNHYSTNREASVSSGRTNTGQPLETSPSRFEPLNRLSDEDQSDRIDHTHTDTPATPVKKGKKKKNKNG